MLNHIKACQAMPSSTRPCPAASSHAKLCRAKLCRAGGQWQVTSGSRPKGARGLSAPTHPVCPAVPGRDGCCSRPGVAGVSVWRGEREHCRASAGAQLCPHRVPRAAGPRRRVGDSHAQAGAVLTSAALWQGLGIPPQHLGTAQTRVHGAQGRVLSPGWQGGLRGSRPKAPVTPRAGGQGSSGAGLWLSPTPMAGVLPP